MRIHVEIADEQVEWLKVLAKRAGLSPEELAGKILHQVLIRSEEADFEAAVDQVMQENDELFRRLA